MNEKGDWVCCLRVNQKFYIESLNLLVFCILTEYTSLFIVMQKKL